MSRTADPPLFRRAEEMFHQLLDVEPEARQARLMALSEEDAALAKEVHSLLEAYGDVAPILDTGACQGSRAVPSEGPKEQDSWIGRRLGDYRLESKLGEGGMGVVYLAHRADEAYDTAVAIKLLRRSVVGEDLESRFRRERQILAQLDHPHIARLHDGGSTEDGVPYFVMDYIEGTALDTHCEGLDLHLQTRIELFLQVCSAVTYAHRRFIVHRDLKPSNILVNTDGHPKLLDFGIAKLLEGDDGSEVTLTAEGLRPLTPRYASPEQLRGETVTTASDTYSLGVVLYRLLTGRLPVTPSATEQVMAPSRDIDPRSAGGRRGTPWRKQIQGDLDMVAVKALAEDPDERYPSVDALAEDLRRWLDGRPILARPPSMLYRLRRFAGRNRLASGLLAALVLSLIGYAVTTTFFSLRLASEHQRVVEEQRRAEQASDFLEGLFDVADPESGSGAEITARQVLRRGAERAESELLEQPELQARVFFTISRLYDKLGLFEEGQQLLERCIALRTQVLGPRHLDTLVAKTELGNTWIELGDFDRAEKVLLQVERDFPEDLPPSSNERARTLGLLGMTKIRQGQLTEAREFAERSLASRQAAAAPDPLKIGDSWHLLALIAFNEGAHERAKDLYTRAVARRGQVVGRLHPAQLSSLKGLGSIARIQGDLEAAESLGEEILALEIDIWGEEHPKIAFSLNNLGLVAMERDDLPRAEALLQQALDLRHKLLGPRHPSISPNLTTLAALRHRQGRPQEAEALYLEALQVGRNTFGSRSPILSKILEPYSRLLLDLDRPLEAEGVQREAYELRREGLGPDHPMTQQTGAVLGAILVDLGRLAEGEPFLEAGGPAQTLTAPRATPSAVPPGR